MGIFAGKVKISIISPDLPATISAIIGHNIILTQIKKLDEITASAVIEQNQYRKLMDLSFRNGESIEMISRIGGYWQGTVLLKRPLFLLGILTAFFLTIYIPSHVFFYTVDGNSEVPSKSILEAAKECGVGFGTSCRKINSEKIKNAIIGRLPDLSWVGITTNGAVVRISVREGEKPSGKDQNIKGIGSIIAERDGIIDECTVYRGTSLCKVGQTVQKGQMLISGYTDCGISVRAERASGEVFAKTTRENIAVFPDAALHRGKICRQKTRYSLLVGKKLIKLYPDSGISSMECVKMIKNYSLVLPGNFVLPVSLQREESISYLEPAVTAAGLQNADWLKLRSSAYLKTIMTAGEILRENTDIMRIPGGYRLSGSYTCREMIGKVKSEEIIR